MYTMTKISRIICMASTEIMQYYFIGLLVDNEPANREKIKMMKLQADT